MTGYIGEIAALGTVVAWTFTSLFFEAAGHRIGSLVVNLIRLIIALFFFVPISLLVHGRPFPFDAPPGAWLWLSISALFGFLICDGALFRAFLVIGPRMAITLMSLVPPVTALFGYLVMGERLEWIEWVGMIVTVTGVLMVVQDRPRRPGLQWTPRRLAWGVFLGLTAALGQAIGLVFSKRGMMEGIGPFEATMIRIAVGAILFAVLMTATGWWPKVIRGLRDRKGIAFTTGGAFCGPFLGVTLSLVAVRYTEAGVAATIISLLPVAMIPAVIFIKKERVHWKGYLGAVLAVTGVALMFLD